MIENYIINVFNHGMAYAQTNQLYGAVNMKESTRSKIPPCSGIKSPKSFKPASLFSILAVKSPIKPNKARFTP